MPDGAAADLPKAALWPSNGSASDPEGPTVTIKIYIVSGHHGVLTVPESFCRECNLFVRAADLAAERVDVRVDVRVISWWTRFLGALRHGGYHPPVMVVGGELLSQGYAVPSPDEVIAAIERAVGR